LYHICYTLEFYKKKHICLQKSFHKKQIEKFEFKVCKLYRLMYLVKYYIILYNNNTTYMTIFNLQGGHSLTVFYFIEFYFNAIKKLIFNAADFP